MESAFHFVINTSDVGRFAIYAGSIAIILLLFLMLQVTIIRLHLIISSKRKRRIQGAWRELIGQMLIGEAVDAPKIRKRDVYYVLEEFDYIFGSIRGAEVELLRKGFYSLSLPVSLTKLLRSRNIKKRLYALITLGNLRERDSWNLIAEQLSQSQPAISLSAARSLVLIDPHKAVDEIVPVILNRRDWPWANIAHILKLAGPKLICKKLSNMIVWAIESKQPSLLRLYDVLKCEEEYPVTCEVLSNAMEDKVASVCLNISQDPKIIRQAREYVSHERWHVRMNAAVAIGRFGDESDIGALTELMKDKQWWVRYRAAQALLGLPSIDSAKLQHIRSSLNDKYADDILVQVINESEYAQ